MRHLAEAPDTTVEPGGRIIRGNVVGCVRPCANETATTGLIARI